MGEIVESLDGAADGAFIVDEDLKIVYVNPAAERLLDLEAAELRQSYCYQVLRGRDEARRLICHGNCLIANQTLSGVPVSDFDIEISSGREGRAWINMSVLHYLDAQKENSRIVHLFRDITQKKKEVRLVERLVEVAKNYHDIPFEPAPREERNRQVEELTPREREILNLLAEGTGTREINEELSISVHTTRNHIQNILQKLGVHSRLEAVLLAINGNHFDEIG